jgi:protein involved in polysaccharide export with SLBB domain
MSGDSIHVKSVNNLVRAGYGFNNVAVFELKDNETIKDLIKYAGGLKIEAKNNSLKLVRYDNNEFVNYDVTSDKYDKYTLNNLDSVYAYKERIGKVTISGYVKHPGNYSISSSDRLLDILNRSGGYIDSAYPLGGSLFRVSSKELESSFASKTYQNIISYLAANPAIGSGAAGLSYILTELKNFQPTGRYIAEFDQVKLEENIQSNIYLNDGDKIHIPSYTSNVFIFGEVGNPGSVLFNEDLTLNGYINKSGGLTRNASSDYMFIVSPNGETLRVQTNGIRRYVQNDYNVYPGSVIFVPKHIGKIEGINLYATVAPIFSSLALSIASLNSINN